MALRLLGHQQDDSHLQQHKVELHAMDHEADVRQRLSRLHVRGPGW
jgi:hypothetical protein